MENNKKEGVINFSVNGNASIEIDKTKIYIHKSKTLNDLNKDLVSVNVYKNKSRQEAEVIEVLKRNRKTFVGKARVGKKTIFVVADDNKTPVDFYIKGGLTCKNGQKVIVEFTKWNDGKSPQGKIIEILGDSGENNAEMNSIMHDYNLPVEFPRDVEKEASKIPKEISMKDISERRDMRGIKTFTIDPKSAKDFDDALSVKNIESGLIEVGIHIADVGHYVKDGTLLNDEAIKRATSVYLVDRVIPMLPEVLSNDICSLKPHVDRLAFSVILTINEDGKVLKEWFGKTIINSDNRFTYAEAQSIIEGDSHVLDYEVRILDTIARKIRKKRIGEGSIEMGGVEIQFKLAPDNKKPIGVYYKVQKEANKLIEEYMLLANKAVAKKLSNAQRTGVYRVHNTPSIEKLNALADICESFGYSVDLEKTSNDLKKELNKLLIEIKDQPEENMIQTLVTRSMSKAYYTIKNIGHYGLGFSHYSHFTSPIRRYPDLITHRLLLGLLENKPKSNPLSIEEDAEWCSQREIIASKAQRDSIKYKQVEFLMDKIGQIFQGVITGVTDWGIYVELTDNKCEGMIAPNDLGDGKWRIDTKKYTADNKLGDKLSLGDEITIVVDNVDLDKKQINFKKF